MARRRTTRRKTRRSPQTINAAKVLEAGLVASAITQGFFNVGLGDFVFNKTALNPSQITARELISGVLGRGAGFGTQTTLRPGTLSEVTTGNLFTEQVKVNLENNGAQMIGSLIVIPAAFKVFNRLSRQPRSMANKALKMSGLPVRV
jgi:hypothetical protein